LALTAITHSLYKVILYYKMFYSGYDRNCESPLDQKFIGPNVHLF